MTHGQGCRVVVVTSTSDETRARALAESLLAGEHPRRWRHTQAVAAEANRLACAMGIDATNVTCAAWLHDIGYAAAVRDTGFHPLDGARHLRRHGWPDDVCRLIAHHSDASRRGEHLGVAEVLESEFPPIPGIASDILWTADATTSPEGLRVTLDERMAEITARYGPDSRHRRTKLASVHSLQAAITRTAQRIAAAAHASSNGRPT